MIASTISQFLLCQIFWRLGRKRITTHKAVPERPDFDINFATENADHLTAPQVEEFDEDAELQAEMWNTLVRDSGGESKFIVTASSIVS